MFRANSKQRYVSMIHKYSFRIIPIWFDTARGSRKNSGSRNGVTFAGGVFRNLAGTRINQNCIAPRSRITSQSCFCSDALHVSPTWNSSAAPSFRSRGPKIEQQFARNSGAIRKKRGTRTLYFTIELCPKISWWARDSYSVVLRTSRGSK